MNVFAKHLKNSFDKLDDNAIANDAFSIYKDSVNSNNVKLNIWDDLKILMKNYVYFLFILAVYFIFDDTSNTIFHYNSCSVLGFRLFKACVKHSRSPGFNGLYLYMYFCSNTWYYCRRILIIKDRWT